MKGNLTYILLLILAIVLYVLSIKNPPKTVDWTMTLKKTDKIPYGTYVFHEQLSSLFPGAQIKTTTRPVYSITVADTSSNNLYFLVNDGFAMTKTDLDQLLVFIRQGNSVFIASNEWSSLEKKLKITAEDEESDTVSNAGMNFPDPRLKTEKNFFLDKSGNSPYFSTFDSCKALVLGTDSSGNPDFLRFSFGRGALFLHTRPEIFSNYFLLKDVNEAYLTSLLRFMPSHIKSVYWDEYYHEEQVETRSLLQYIVSQPGLAFAYWGTLVLLLIFVIFESKRRQKIVPIIEPVKNTTLEFSETVGLLYFNKHNNINIALKMITQFQEYIANRFFIQIQGSDPDMIKVLASKSGLDEEFLFKLFSKIMHIQNYKMEIVDEVLLDLNEDMERFYKQVKNPGIHTTLS